MKISNWWNKNMNDGMLPTFEGWVGDFNSQSKIVVRNYIISKKYKSIIDIGCGLCDTFYGYKNDNYDINYTGFDSCDYFLNKAAEKNINTIKGDMNKIDNITDDSFDIVYGRHVLEHLPNYKDCLKELIRISKYETIIIFFIKPEDKEDIRYDTNQDLYHNIYSKIDIENFLIEYDFKWEDINDKEIILHIIKK
jgi:ubiquinone/menaquinone biosynthesis C-methylase UbiE